MHTELQAWSAEQTQLWQRLETHALDRPGVAWPFSAKLAREQGWSPTHAGAAIREYRRFCFLAASCDHRVAPSPAVDAVWHLHLLYTHDYWEHFCPAVLMTALHHEPADGQRDHGLALRADYTATLHSYQRFFGPPDERYWPPRRDWFRRTSGSLASGSSNWRARLRRLLATVAASVGLSLLAFPARAVSPNPLDWQGPQFLLLYLALLIGIPVATVFWRKRMRMQLGGANKSAKLSAYEAAFLAGGATRVVDAGVAELGRRGAIEFDAETKQLRVRDQVGDQVHDQESKRQMEAPLDQLQQCIRADGSIISVLRRAEPWLSPIRRSLEQKRLLLSGEMAAAIARSSAMPMWIVVGFGATKIALGIQRDRPVGLLVFLTLIALVIALVLFFKRPRTTQAGEAWLHQARARHKASTLAPRGADLAMAVALVGTAVLADTALAGYHGVRQPASSSGDGGSSGSDGGGSDGGSSDSGGGGGCGGCGGGD